MRPKLCLVVRFPSMYNTVTMLERLTSCRRRKACEQTMILKEGMYHVRSVSKARYEKWMGVGRGINSEESGGWGRDSFGERGG